MNRTDMGQVTIFAALLAVLLLSGCGQRERWPVIDGDYVRVTADRGMARVWGVQVDVEQAGGTVAEAVETGEFALVPEESNGSVELRLGNVTVGLATTGSEKYDLTVNGKRLGQVRAGSRLKITADRQVFVNDELRK